MLDEIIISIDAMGGDNAPEIVIKGIDYFLNMKVKIVMLNFCFMVIKIYYQNF